MIASKKLLEDALGTSIPGLAYPFGYSSTAVRHAAIEAGYAYACIVGNAMASPQHDPLALPRLTVKASTGEDAFAHAVDGRSLSKIYGTDRMLTKGWAVVRRTKAVVTGVRPVRETVGSDDGPGESPRRDEAALGEHDKGLRVRARSSYSGRGLPRWPTSSRVIGGHRDEAVMSPDRALPPAPGHRQSPRPQPSACLSSVLFPVRI